MKFRESCRVREGRIRKRAQDKEERKGKFINNDSIRAGGETQSSPFFRARQHLQLPPHPSCILPPCYFQLTYHVSQRHTASGVTGNSHSRSWPRNAYQNIELIDLQEKSRRWRGRRALRPRQSSRTRKYFLSSFISCASASDLIGLLAGGDELHPGSGKLFRL